MASFACNFPGCGRSYQRKEHLVRHQQNHFRAQTHKCPYCSNAFSRTDVLRRHVEHRHKAEELPSTRAPKACQRCHMRKMRCDGSFPCSACLQRHAQCAFDSSTAGSTNEEMPPSSNGNEMQQHIDAYFTHFHPFWPFLHKETFNPHHEPAVLLQSVVMIGLWTMQDETSKQTAVKLHETLVASISQQQEGWDCSGHRGQPEGNDEPWPVATYQGILLNIIFAILSAAENSKCDGRGRTRELDLKAGEKVTLSEANHRLLVALVKSALARGMFSYADMLAQARGRSSNVIFIWIGIDVKRFALTLFRVWSMCSRGADGADGQLLSTKDLRFAMPERENLWGAWSDEEFLRRLESEMERGKGMHDRGEDWMQIALEGDGVNEAARFNSYPLVSLEHFVAK